MATTPILDDVVPLRDIAAELHKHVATLKRWADKPGGPPLTYVGRFPHGHRPSWRQWFLDNQRVVESPAPRRGRPRKAEQLFEFRAPKAPS